MHIRNSLITIRFYEEKLSEPVFGLRYLSTGHCEECCFLVRETVTSFSPPRPQNSRPAVLPPIIHAGTRTCSTCRTKFGLLEPSPWSTLVGVRNRCCSRFFCMHYHLVMYIGIYRCVRVINDDDIQREMGAWMYGRRLVWLLSAWCSLDIRLRYLGKVLFTYG